MLYYRRTVQSIVMTGRWQCWSMCSQAYQTRKSKKAHLRVNNNILNTLYPCLVTEIVLLMAVYVHVYIQCCYRKSWKKNNPIYPIAFILHPILQPSFILSYLFLSYPITFIFREKSLKKNKIRKNIIFMNALSTNVIV